MREVVLSRMYACIASEVVRVLYRIIGRAQAHRRCVISLVGCRKIWVVLGASLVVAACGGEEGEGGDAGTGSESPAATDNRAPVISGKPDTSVIPGSTYSFSPTASDPDGDSLTFSVANLPAWATFNVSNGRLSGTPSSGDLGTYENVTVRVTDGDVTVSLTTFDIAVIAVGQGSATVSWASPTTRGDGSPLMDLAGFKIYWGTSAGNYTNSITVDNPGLTTYVVDGLNSATWYFAATAFDSAGAESRYSNVASKTIP